MYCTCDQLYVLFSHIVCLLVPVVLSDLTAAEPVQCGGEYRNVDVGDITSPANVSELQPVICTWILSAPPGKKLLVNIDHVSIPNTAEAVLALYVDGEEVNVPDVCDPCQSNIVGGVLKVTLELVARNLSEASLTEENVTNVANSNDSDVFFLISYKSFDPRTCGVPDAPSNGFYVEKGRSKGSKLRYHCYPPYELIGSGKSTCVTTADSPIPIWEEKPPRCVISPCNGRVLSRTAGKGMIVHPGYPDKTVLSGQHCEWHVRTDEFRQVVANIKSFSLPLGEKKRKNSGAYLDFYDGSHDNLMFRLRGQENPRTATTSSNHLILVLQTDNFTWKGNDASDAFGFLIEYASTCEVLTAPMNGSVISASLSIGSNASFHCHEGFELVGNSVLSCMRDANWNSPPPTCHFLGIQNATVPNNTLVSVGEFATPVDDDDYGDDNDDGSTTTTSFSAVTSEWESNPVVFSSVNDSSVSFTTISPSDSSYFNGKGHRKVDVPSHQNANAKSFITKLNKEEEKGKSLSSSGRSNNLHNGQDKEKRVEESFAFSDFMVILIASAIAIAVGLGLVLLGVCLWYRKQYPVRMNFGRKFETFENPIYQTRGKKTSSSPPTVPENPAELQRLTAARLSL